MSLGRAALDIRVTALALLLQAAGVRLVAPLTVAVPLVDLAVLALVTAFAFDLEGFGAVGQAAMAVGAGGVPLE